MSTIDMALDGGLASAVATLFSNPFDVVRIRMQLQGAQQAKGSYTATYTSLPQGMFRIAREEGIRALQKGLSPALLWQVTQNSIRIGLYPLAKEKLSRGLGQEEGMLVGIGAAMACGTVGCIAASPFQMVKTKLQAQRCAPVPRQPSPPTVTPLPRAAATTTAPAAAAAAAPQAQGKLLYTGVADAMRSIYSKNGLSGLWQGCGVAIQRTLVFSPAQLVSYDVGKRHAAHYLGLPTSDIRVHIGASVFSSLMITVLTNPVEVVMTRSFNHRQGTPEPYSSNVVVAMQQVYRVEGIHGLYKGSTALFSRTLPHTVMTFIALEAIRTCRERYTTRAYTSGTEFNRK